MNTRQRPSARPRSRMQERLAALIIVAALLFSPPLLLVVDRLPSVTGVWLVVYLFGAWMGIIGLTAWLMERHPSANKGTSHDTASSDEQDHA